MQIPQKISPCPIIEAAVEIRFESEMPSDAVFGVLYNDFKSEYKKIEKLPILQFPEFVRTRDTSLRFQPLYKLLRDDFVLQLGPNVLAIANVNQYVGWPIFSKKILDTMVRIEKLGIADKAVRIGIRYINFFELDIYENIKLKFTLSEQRLIAEQITFRCKLTLGKFVANLNILNNGNITKNNSTSLMGSIIDIDTYRENEIDFLNIKSLLDEAHLEEKKLFFTLLKEEFLQQLNPEY